MRGGPVRAWMLVALVVACAQDAKDRRDGGHVTTADDPRAALLDLCDATCELQNAGDDCDDDAFLAWCQENCRTIDGLLPDDCLGEAEDALLCWSDQDWYCVGNTSYYGVQIPIPGDEEACAEETEMFYECG